MEFSLWCDIGRRCWVLICQSTRNKGGKKGDSREIPHFSTNFQLTGESWVLNKHSWLTTQHLSINQSVSDMNKECWSNMPIVMVCNPNWYLSNIIINLDMQKAYELARMYFLPWKTKQKLDQVFCAWLSKWLLCLYVLKNWRFGRVTPIPHSLTHTHRQQNIVLLSLRIKRKWNIIKSVASSVQHTSLAGPSDVSFHHHFDHQEWVCRHLELEAQARYMWNAKSQCDLSKSNKTNLWINICICICILIPTPNLNLDFSLNLTLKAHIVHEIQRNICGTSDMLQKLRWIQEGAPPRQSIRVASARRPPNGATEIRKLG